MSFFPPPEIGAGKEKERKRNINVWLPLTCPLLGNWPATQACSPTGNQTCDLWVHRPALSPLSHTSQGRTDVFFSLVGVTPLTMLGMLRNHFIRYTLWGRMSDKVLMFCFSEPVSI